MRYLALPSAFLSMVLPRFPLSMLSFSHCYQSDTLSRIGQQIVIGILPAHTNRTLVMCSPRLYKNDPE